MAFGVAVFSFVRPLFRDAETRGIASQLLSAATSVGANYRAATHARSSKEWRAKLGVVVEESDESIYWLLFIKKALPEHAADPRLAELTDEAEQLTKIFGASLRTSRLNEKAYLILGYFLLGSLGLSLIGYLGLK